METKERTVITVESTVNAPVEKVWEYWTKPEHIRQWNHASDDWHTPWVKADFREGGQFVARMEAKDFTKVNKSIKVTESFEAEDMNSLELQRTGWQAILDNFKKYTESN
jgi:uncharacterized protein YndB with AHSA1/START domain